MKTDNDAELLFLRASIDNIDSAILSLLFHRAQVVNTINRYKALHNLSSARSSLREKIIEDLVAFSSELNLRETFVRTIFDRLFKESDAFLCEKAQTAVNTFLASNKEILTPLNDSLKRLDISFCSLLSERMHLVRWVGAYKKAHHIVPLANARWETVLKTKMDLAESLHINPETIRTLYTLIHEEALDLEEKSGGTF